MVANKTGPVAGNDETRELVLANNSQNSRTLSDLQAQHLSVIFGLPADTAVTMAELVFAGCPR